MTDEQRLGIGLPFDGGIIVDIQGDKWGIVEMAERPAHRPRRQFGDRQRASSTGVGRLRIRRAS